MTSRSRCLEVILGEDEEELVGTVEFYGDPLFVLECLAVIVGEIAMKSGVPELEVAVPVLYPKLAHHLTTRAFLGS